MTGPEGMRLCSNCGEPNPLRAKFCLECGTPMAQAVPATPSKLDLVDQLPQETGAAGERRVVSVLFADLSGFTAYSEGSDVEDVRAIATETADRLGQIVENYGGTVDKIIGDCVMAVFGAPVAHEDDPERCVRAAIDMQACVKENQERFAGLKLSVGVQTGEAMWAPVGPDGRYTVLGDTVNTAARLQGAADKGEIVIGQPTHHAVADVIECEPMEPVKAKNKAEPVPAWKAVAVKGERSKHKPVLAKLKGRDEELKRLREAWEYARTEKRPYGVTVLGSPGVGKSRLIETLTGSLGDSALVLRGRCLPYGEGITYWPVIEIIRQVAEIHHDDDSETVSRKLGALLYSLGSEDLDELRTMAVALANLIGAPTTPRGTYSATEISRGELHWGLRRILELGSRILPLVLVIEDLHRAEPTLIELMQFLFDDDAEGAILGILTARPEFEEIGAELLEPRRNRRVLELDTLTDDAARAIVRELMGDEDLPEEVVSEILHSAGGNPLFLEEIALMWRDARNAEGSDGRSLGGVPGGLQALIDSRLDLLSVNERRLVSSAAVIGDVFWAGAVRAVIANGLDVDAALDALEARDVIRSHPASSIGGEREYGFKHGLIRDAAYQRLTKSERATLHERCGNWIGELPGAAQEFAEIIAYHLEQACLIAADLDFAETTAPMLRAARALEAAGEKSERREGVREAERFFARALALLGDSFPETALDLKLRRARILSGLGRYEEAMDEMRQTADRALELRHDEVRCTALLTLAQMEVLLEHASDARSDIKEADALARRLSDPLLRIRVLWIEAQIQDRLDGQPSATVDTLRTAIALAEEASDAESILTGRMRLGVMFFNAGRLDEAGVQFERCLELAKELGSLRHQSWLSAFLGHVRHYCGPRDEAEPLFAQAYEWMERTGDRHMQVQTLQWRSQLALDQGDPSAALRYLRTAERLIAGLRGGVVVELARHLAELLLVQGRTAEVAEVVESALSETTAETAMAQAEASLLEAFGAAGRGDHAAARRAFTNAIPLLESKESPIDLGDARLSYARLLESWGDITAASDQLERARESFARVAGAATVAQIDADLARLRDVEVMRPARSSELASSDDGPHTPA